MISDILFRKKKALNLKVKTFLIKYKLTLQLLSRTHKCLKPRLLNRRYTFDNVDF